MSEAVGNLPVQLSDFIGREKETVEVQKLLSDHRLVTLTGAGGSGKTRLSIKVANELLDIFEQGVWFIRFAPLSDSELVPQAVASVLGVSEKKKRPIFDTLIGHLKELQSLLIFDNCEHLIDACAKLAEKLLQNCPNIKILSTSREPLGIPSEVTWSVPPMSLPERQPWRDTKSGQNALSVYRVSESVQLFLNRAVLVTPDFELTTDNGAWVAEICRRLDGMPLAIELAAARVRALSVRQIAERLDDRFNLLTGGSRTAPARHQTLSATLDWSYALLSEVECRVLQRLSVFSGGATMEAAESVCAGEGVEVAEVLDALSHLVDKSLVTADKPGRGETRYRLLETIRQYALEKLSEAGEADISRNHHLNFFIQWAEMAEPHLDKPEQVEWLERYEAEHDNLRAALEWCNDDQKRSEAGLRLAAACGRFWRLHSYLSEGRKRLSTALSRAGGHGRTITHARVLTFISNITYLQSDYPAMRPLAERALSIWRELGEAGRFGTAITLDMLGELATEEGDYVQAPVLFKEALEIFRELNNLRGIGGIHMQLGWVAIRTGDLEQAKIHLEEFLSLTQQIGDKTYLSFAFSGLGEVAVRQGEYERAASLLGQSLALNRERGDKWGIGTSLGSLGWAALRQQDFKRMKEMLGESLVVRLETSDKGGIAWCLEKLAEAKYEQSQLDEAAKIFGHAAALRAPIGSVIDPADQPDHIRIISDLRSALGEDAFAALWAEGETMTLEEIIEIALAETETIAEPIRAEKEKFGGLTPREREVAMLIAQGKSNREIAEAMTVGIKTIETYITRILNKLGFTSRVQIATWAMEKGLK